MAANFAPPAADASLEDNIRFLIQAAVNTHLQFQETKALLTSNQTRITKVEKDVTQLSSEIKQLKELVNHREQQARSLSVRIINLPVSDDEIDGPDPSAAAAKQAYERIIRPILVSAKSKSKISSVPAIQNAIVKAYRLSKPSARLPPPPVVIQLVSANIKTAIFTSKKDSMPVLSDQDKALGFRRVLLTEDLTPPTFAFLKLLKNDDRVSRAWTVEGQIRFIKAGDSDNFVHKVKSVYNSIDSLFTP
jgi:hypothetical protein